MKSFSYAYKYIFLIVTCIVLFLFFPSCKIGHKYVAPEIENMPDTFETYGLKKGVAADIGWSSLYNDTILRQLIDTALENNKDALIATARIKELMARKKISFANMFPNVGVNILAQNEELTTGEKDPLLQAQLTTSWEIDIWGKLRWENEASIAEYMQSIEAQRALKLTIIAEVAQAYFELKTLDRELSIIEQTLEARKESVRILKLRYDAGLTSEIPYRQSLVELTRTETLIPDLKRQIAQKENELAVLMGKFPSVNIPRTKSISEYQIPPSLPVEMPSTLLNRRPDVIIAEQKIKQANAKAGVAYTSMFPSLNMSARYGFEHSELSEFLKNPLWFISGSLVGPIFDMGKNKANYDASKAAYEAEVYNYEKRILGVFQEVNNAIIAYIKMHEKRESNTILYESAKDYHNLARIQYINGTINYIDVLDAQRQLFDAEISLNNAILNEEISIVSLYKALGGGVIK